MLTVEELSGYIGSPEADDEFLEVCIDSGETLVDSFVGEHVVPEDVLRHVYLIVCSDIYYRRNSPGGIAQFASMDGTPMRVARDPMNSVYQILFNYVPRAL